MSERSIELVLKTSRGDEPLVGSNPTLTAMSKIKMANKLMEWSAYEFEHREKSLGWYATFVIIALLFIAYELYQRDYFAALTFFIIAVIGFGFARMVPQELTVIISDKGINAGNFHIPYVNIKKFWIVDHSKARTLHLETTAYLNHFIIIQLGQVNSDDVRSVLVKYLPEGQPNRESIAHRLARHFHF